jgi:superfamily II DNA or RNA helicase
MGSLAEMLAPTVSASIRQRGERYADEGRVRITRTTATRVEASVRGTSTYGVTLARRDGAWEASCSCAAFDGRGPCKHLWAVIVTCDEDGIMGVGSPTPPSKWRQRLRGLGLDAPRERDPWASLRTEDRRVLYGLNVAESLRSGRPSIETFRQTRRVSGDWGAPSAFFGPGSYDFAEADRTLIQRIQAIRSGYGDPLRTSLGKLVPELCGTGRFVLIGNDGLEDTPLALDDGPPWVFGLSFDREGGEFVVRGYLARGEERVPLEKPVLVLESGWLILDRAFARLDDRDAADLIHELRRGGPIKVPLAEEKAAIERIVSLPSRPLLSGAAVPPIITEAPRPRMRLLHDDYGDASCKVEFDYGGTRVPAEAGRAIVHVEGRLVCRDPAAETAALRALLDRGAVLQGNVAVLRARRLQEAVRALLADGWTIEADGRPYRTGGAFHASVRSGIDWFEIDGAMDFGGEAVALPALLEAARTGVVRLGDGSTGVLPEEWLLRWGFLGKSGLRFAKAQGFFLDALLADRPEVDVDARFAELRKRIASFEGIRPRREGEGFRGTLRPYQREALGWFAFLREAGLGGCLADDMGLGKTVQVLALLAERRGSKPSLVVAPKSVVPNWVLEARKFAPRLRVLDYTGAARRERVVEGWDLVVTTYGTLRRDAKELADVSFDYAILDEAQMIKNPAAACAKAARLLRADHRLALTGTPVENHLGDLWSILDFLNPGMAPRVEAFRALGDAVLQRALRPFFLRRTKEQVLKDLPEKSEQILLCDLDGKQRKAYDEIRDHYRASLLGKTADGGLARMKIHVLEALLRLRQTACHHGLVDPARAGEPCAKLETLLPLLEEVIAEGHKALVFSQFTSFLAILRRELDAKGIRYEYLDGQTRRREEVVERFQSAPAGECPLFLISLKAGGFGLNLTAADYVFLLDPWWNPAVETQAIDRTHRIGQTRKVMAYRIIGKGTVEERVLELQASKRALAEAVLGADQTLLEGLTREDLELLLS